jgi:hypothetical protein
MSFHGTKFLFYAANIIIKTEKSIFKSKIFHFNIFFIPSSASPLQNKPRPWPPKHSTNQYPQAWGSSDDRQDA